MKRTFFAVTALRKNRWYWVVWPSLETLQSDASVGHVADGYEKNKAKAVERALEVAGRHGEWIAAKYARQYHRQLSRAKRAQERGLDHDPRAAPAVLEFLYRDIRGEARGQWHSVPHRVLRKTKKHVFVERRAYNPERVSGGWVDHDPPTWRLMRSTLERDGYALAPVTADLDDPLFFTTPYQKRATRHAGIIPDCFRVLGLSYPCTIAEVKVAYRKRAKRAHPDHGGSHEEFLALQVAYEQALRLCRYTS